GIAVSDTKNDGTGQVVLTGTFSITDPSIGTVGDHIIAARFAEDGTRAYAFFYTFEGATQGKAIALNSNSTASPKGSLAYIAGNIGLNGNQQILVFQI